MSVAGRVDPRCEGGQYAGSGGRPGVASASHAHRTWVHISEVPCHVRAAQDQRRYHRTQRAPDVGNLGGDPRAAGAARQVRPHLVVIVSGQRVAHPPAEMASGRVAGRVGDDVDVAPQVALAEPFHRAEHQRLGAVRGQSGDRAHDGRLVGLDLDVPERRPPALG